MISKKILALVLALSVIVCALPMGSVFAANESVFPYTAETLTFTEEDFADDKIPVYMTTGFYIDFTKASDSFKAMATSGSDVTDKVFISGTVTFDNVVLNFTDIPAKGFAANNTHLNLWASSVVADDADLVAKIAAATDVANMEYAGDVISTSGKPAIRNFKRYVLHENDVTVTEEEDYLPEGETSWDESPMYGRTLAATKAEFTLTYKTARPTATAAFDAESIFIPTAKIENAVPLTEDADNGIHAWYKMQGIWQQHKESITGNDIAYCATGQNNAVGIDGPYFVFKATKSGTYNVYASRRDRYYKDTNGTLDTDVRRDIYLNISGTDLSFKSKDTLPKDSTLAYRLIPEDNATTVTLTAGQEVVVRIMDGTGAWAGSNGLVLVPVGKTHDDLVGTVVSADNFTAAYNYNVTARQVSDVTINTADNAATAQVTVNGTAVTAKTEGAYLKDAVKFNNIKRYDLNGNYIKAPTVLDALVEADAADDSCEITNVSATGYLVTVNGTPVKALDQVTVKADDVITCDAVDKTNFAPLSMQGPGDLINNYGSIGDSDGLREDGSTFSGMDKIVTYGSAATRAAWPIDITVRDAFAGCYLTGYIKVVGDDTSSTGTETNNVNLFINMPIKHSAIKTADGRLEFAYETGKDHGIFLSVVNVDLDGDGVVETYKRYLTNGKVSTWYDFTNVYLVNSSFDPDNLVVTATEVSDGVYQLTTTKSVPVTLIRVTKDSNGVVTSIVKEHTLIDFMDADGTTVTVSDNETVYVWKGTEIPAGTTMQPLCAPLTK